tara:strand:+ start:51 stop:629 length:579 start_codon:yes stop_codon:yes gene_type:complete
MICKQTGKSLNNFNGEINIDARFSYATRYFIYKNVTLFFNEGELDIEKSFPDGSIDDYEINEFFPQITVSIVSPFSNELGDEIQLKNQELYDDLEGSFNSELGIIDSDVIMEVVDFNETTSLEFDELWIPSKQGKYRGYMKIDFKDIDSEEELLEKVISDALENYEWEEGSPEGILESGNLGYINIPVILKS